MVVSIPKVIQLYSVLLSVFDVLIFEAWDSVFGIFTLTNTGARHGRREHINDTANTRRADA